MEFEVSVVSILNHAAARDAVVLAVTSLNVDIFYILDKNNVTVFSCFLTSDFYRYSSFDLYIRIMFIKKPVYDHIPLKCSFWVGFCFTVTCIFINGFKTKNTAKQRLKTEMYSLQNSHQKFLKEIAVCYKYSRK